jgi:hypothetical protein
VVRGDHVLFREYAYVNLNTRNRRAFVQAAWTAFRHMDTGLVFSVFDLHSLLSLLCKVRPPLMS